MFLLSSDRRLGAYYTVELSLLMPIIFVTISLIAHFAFMLYGRALLSQDAYLLAYRGVILSEEDPGAYARERADEQFGSQYMGNRKPSVEDVTVDSSAKTVRVTLSTSAFHGWYRHGDVGYFGSWGSSASWEASYLDPKRRIRMTTRIVDIARMALEATNADSL
ncbi:hypothetical protein [Butyrivibrio sp. MC2013]|uniref:hypothetical protein n=1 Tax=Butyrivibrio sp. MC2013 TaxID=1280686 RepID=UPI0003FFE047|nr:hypothetical protein [Butyrivibrio sp. MC2013]